MKLTFKSGFTLVEMVVVLGILAILIPAMFALFFTNLRAQSKVRVLQEVKSNGDNALSTIESLVKKYGVSLHSASPATSANEICTTSGSSYNSGTIYIKDQLSNSFAFYLDNEKIASESSVSGVDYLTNDNAVISDFSIDCQRGSEFSNPIISIAFTVSQANATTTRQEEKAKLLYQTKIKLRNY